MTVSPRPASTVILMDEMSRVYLTKRPVTMKFFGGFYVFPGGSVDKGDSELDSRYIKMKEPMNPLNSAYYIAAARELFEEVGILIGSNGDGNSPRLEKEVELEYRRHLIQGEMPFLELLKKEGLHLNLENFTYIGTLTTPEGRPVRFETCFFIVQLPSGQFPNPDLNEVEEASWFTPKEALSAYHNGTISLAPPTILALKTILDHQKGSSLFIPDVNPLIWLKESYDFSE